VRIVERSPDQRQLQLLYIPQEPRRVMPDEIAEEIVLTHPAQPPTASFLERLFRNQVVGAAGVSTVDLLAPLEGRYFYVLACGAFHDDTASRNMTILLGSSTLGYTELLATFTAGTNKSGTIGRAFLVPPGLNVRFSLNALVTPFVLTGRMTYSELLLAENHPAI